MKIIKLSFLAMLLSINTMAQKYTIVCKAETATDQSKGMLKLSTHEEYANFKDGVLIFTGDASKLTTAQLYIDYDGHGYGHVYSVLVAPGKTNLSISDIESIDDVKVTGNPDAETYENKLLRPVLAFNDIAKENSTKFMQAKAKNSADSLLFKKVKNEAIYNCFQIPIAFIRSNPKSPLNLIALKMMGKGNPVANVNKDTLKEIYSSLALDIKESDEGKKYETWLNAL